MKEKHGTFQTNKFQKIHSWYPYLAGFSSELVEEKINEFKLTTKHKIFDPFAGVGTTLLVAKEHNIESAGMEINPFVVFVANTKLFQNYSKKEIETDAQILKERILSFIPPNLKLNKVPDLLTRAFSPNIFHKLIFLKNEIDLINNKKVKNLFLLTLVSILKEVSNCSNFSPYLEFKNEKLVDIDVFSIYMNKLSIISNDIISFKNTTKSIVHEGSAKDLSKINEKFDFILTSPPYLNNWDYSWITKIELYFLDYAKSDKELTNLLRNKLMKSSTYVLQNVDKIGKLEIPDSKTKNKILEIILKIENERKLKKSNSKKYDLAVREYFNDTYIIFKELSKILNKKAHCLWVIGDSALYGVHVPTDVICAEIAELTGFKLIDIEILRKRRATRHKIELRESIIKLQKL